MASGNFDLLNGKGQLKNYILFFLRKKNGGFWPPFSYWSV